MPFLVNVYGCPSLWQFVHFCLYCKASRANPLACGDARTLASMREDFEKKRKHQKHFPAVYVPVENAVPSPLHLFLGIVPMFLEEITELATQIDRNSHTTICLEIEEIMKKNRLEKGAWLHQFTG